MDFEQANNVYVSTKNEGQNGDSGTFGFILVVITVLFAVQSEILTKGKSLQAKSAVLKQHIQD